MCRFLALIILSFGVQSATFEVTRSDDPVPDGCSPNDCSLREAIVAANDTPALDVVELPADQYNLALPGNDNNALTGDLDITAPVEVRGASADTTTINGSLLNDRLFDVRINQQMSIMDVTLAQGDAGNSAGGAILISEADVVVNRVVFTQNEARYGSAIYIGFGTLSVDDSVFTTNSSIERGGIDVVNSQVTIRNSFFINNESASGSSLHALFQQSNQFIDISDTVFINNTSLIDGGAIYIGAATQDPIDISIKDSAFLNNQAVYGGAMGLFGTLDVDIEAVNFVANKALNGSITGAVGGAIYFEAQSVTGPGQILVEHSLFESNQSSEFGGAVLIGGIAVLIAQNSTFSQNQSPACPVICATDSSQLGLTHVTAMNNSSVQTADLWFESNVTADVTNSVIAGDCDILSGAMVNSHGGNIESPGNTCQFGTGVNDLVAVLPRLLGLNPELLAYGGPTKSHVINQSYSVLIGNAVSLPAITLDQRYFTRDAQPDSGATEHHPGDLDLIYKDSYEG